MVLRSARARVHAWVGSPEPAFPIYRTFENILPKQAARVKFCGFVRWALPTYPCGTAGRPEVSIRRDGWAAFVLYVFMLMVGADHPPH